MGPEYKFSTPNIFSSSVEAKLTSKFQAGSGLRF